MAGAQDWVIHSAVHACGAFWNGHVETWMQGEPWISTLCRALLQALGIGGLSQKRPQRKQKIYNTRDIHSKAHDIFLYFFSEMPNQLSVSLKMAVIFSLLVNMPLSCYSCLSKKSKENLNTIQPRLQGLDIPWRNQLISFVENPFMYQSFKILQIHSQTTRSTWNNNAIPWSSWTVQTRGITYIAYFIYNT